MVSSYSSSYKVDGPYNSFLPWKKSYFVFNSLWISSGVFLPSPCAINLEYVIDVWPLSTFVFNFVFIFLSFQEVEDHVAFLITVPTALAIFFAIFILVCVEPVFKKLLRIFSLVVWVCLVAMGYLFMCFGGIICPWDQVRLSLLLILLPLGTFPRNILYKSIHVCFCGTSYKMFLSLSGCMLRLPQSAL